MALPSPKALESLVSRKWTGKERTPGGLHGKFLTAMEVQYIIDAHIPLPDSGTWQTDPKVRLGNASYLCAQEAEETGLVST